MIPGEPASEPTRPTVPLDPARVRALFDAACDLAPAERAGFLTEACGGDRELAREVQALAAFADAPPPEVALEAPAAPEPAPEAIDRFRVLDTLGQGGMGVVYRCHDPALDREVALKLVSHGGLGGQARPDGRARLLREAQAMARIAHPNVVPVYEVGLHGERVFVAMELVRGTTLTAWLRGERRPWREILRRLVDAGRGLAAAHRAGILHRDFKPDNVLIGDDGRARVLDFGLARSLGEDAAVTAVAAAPPANPAAQRALAVELTREGAVVGTLGFMSPEHWHGTLSPLADQWSFAVTAYYALLGQLPFAGGDARAQRDAVLAGSPPRPPPGEVPPHVVGAILRGMERLPEDRFPTLAALLDELEAVLAVDPSDDRTAYRRQRHRLATGFAMFGGASFVFAGVRTRFRFDFGVRDVFLQIAVALVLLVLATLVFRRVLWRTGHDRRVVLMWGIMLSAIAAHRALALSLDAEVAHVLRTDAVFVASLYAVGAVAIEHWLRVAAGIMIAYVPLSYAVPSIAVPAFGAALIGTIALGIWFWREPPPSPRGSASRSGGG